MSSKAPRASLSAEAASFVPLAGGAATEGATSTRAAGARAAGEPAGASPEPVSAAVAAGGAEADRGAGEQDAGAAEDGDGDVETADGRDRPTRLGSAARRWVPHAGRGSAPPAARHWALAIWRHY